MGAIMAGVGVLSLFAPDAEEAAARIALEVIRHHRLIEMYLTEALGYRWDEVHDEADRLEHVISEQFEARIAAALGHPNHDPHGDPIPSPDGSLPAQDADGCGIPEGKG